MKKICLKCSNLVYPTPDKTQESFKILHSGDGKGGDRYPTWVFPSIYTSDFCYYHRKESKGLFNTDPSDYQDGTYRPLESHPCLNYQKALGK